MKHPVALTLLVLLLGGCATQSVPPAAVYTLAPDFDGASASARKPHNPDPILKLAPIRSTRPFTSTRMLYMKNGIEQNSFAYSRWSDSPVAMLQLQLTEGLNRSGLFRAVLPPAAAMKSDLVLEGTLLDFSLHLDDGQAAAVMEIRFLLLDSRHRKVLASRLFRTRVPMDKPSPAATAEALNQATRMTLQQLTGWLAGLRLSGN
ncbi:MAG: hypothetical protein DSZ01_03815 [Gammaproteobacteria bacterium]|nr:MAG: hypothetical protein DSZ01_03815 [Gammaproteobacteria bacterium]